MSHVVLGDQSRDIHLDHSDPSPLSLCNEILDKAVGKESDPPWALLDFPTHSNVGDSAIWLGTLALLEARFSERPSYVTPNAGYPASLDKYMPEGPVFLNGGGNFGDIWHGFWENRVAILRHFKHRRLVQMPQSIHFSDLQGEALIQTQHAISKHPDFTMLVRDHPSLDFALANFDCPVYLCPDMAFGLHHLSSRTLSTASVFALMREDLERRDDGSAAKILLQYARVNDWINAKRPPFIDRFIPRLTRRIPQLNRHLMAPLEATYRRQADRHLKRGIELLSQGELIITDRLHGHILSTLMRKKHIVLDNSYGKIFNYIDTWPDDGFTVKAENVEDAVKMLQEFS